ncbi:MAG: hypothetical protein DMF81_21060 [Acidobacteria bacterium]|nr:MAG: hypothetical protein DMF81_21060 [Acidobacteriota bacterium]
MTNIYKDPKKRDMKRRLLEIAIETLQAQGWTVERTTGGASIRTIRKGGESYRISIRTSQDQWIAFPRREDDKAWVTLSSVDVVVVVSVDDLRHPSAARVHWIEADKLRVRFDRAYMARKKAKYSVPLGRGLWIPLYIDEDGSPSHAGGGVGNMYPEIARVPLAATEPERDPLVASRAIATQIRANGSVAPADDQSLTIGEAKRRLALTLGVPEASIKISVEA